MTEDDPDITTISLRIPRRLLAAVDSECGRRGIHRPQAVQEALRTWQSRSASFPTQRHQIPPTVHLAGEVLQVARLVAAAEIDRLSGDTDDQKDTPTTRHARLRSIVWSYLLGMLARRHAGPTGLARLFGDRHVLDADDPTDPPISQEIALVRGNGNERPLAWLTLHYTEGELTTAAAVLEAALDHRDGAQLPVDRSALLHELRLNYNFDGLPSQLVADISAALERDGTGAVYLDAEHRVFTAAAAERIRLRVDRWYGDRSTLIVKSDNGFATLGVSEDEQRWEIRLYDEYASITGNLSQPVDEDTRDTLTAAQRRAAEMLGITE